MLFHCIQTLYYKYIQGDIGKCVAEAQNSEWAGFHMLDSIDRTGQALATTATLDILLVLMTSKVSKISYPRHAYSCLTQLEACYDSFRTMDLVPETRQQSLTRRKRY
jgi:hypothetical protein